MASEKPLNSKDYTDEDLVSMSTETVGAQPSQRSLWAQAELTRRFIQVLKDSKESTEKYNKALFFLTAMMFLIAVVQLIFVSISLPGYSAWARNAGTFALILVMGYIGYKWLKDLGLLK